MAENRDKEMKDEQFDRDEIAEAARDPEEAKKKNAHLFGEGMTTPDSTKIPYTSEGEPDYRAKQGEGSSRLGRDESER